MVSFLRSAYVVSDQALKDAESAGYIPAQPKQPLLNVKGTLILLPHKGQDYFKLPGLEYTAVPPQIAGVTLVNCRFEDKTKYFSIFNSDLALALRVDRSLVDRVTLDVRDLGQIVGVLTKVQLVSKALGKGKFEVAYQCTVEIERTRPSAAFFYSQNQKPPLPKPNHKDYTVIVQPDPENNHPLFFLKWDRVKKDKGLVSTLFKLLDYQTGKNRALSCVSLETVEGAERCLEELTIYQTLRDVTEVSQPLFYLLEGADRDQEGRVTQIKENCAFSLALPVEGVSLKKFANKLDLPKKLELFNRIFRACIAIHERKIVHRNLKHKTIRIIESEPAYSIAIYGFTTACTFDSPHLHKEEGCFKRFPPEVLTKNVIDPAKIDCFMLGTILYELCEEPLPYMKKIPKHDDTWSSPIVLQVILEGLAELKFDKLKLLQQTPLIELIQELLAADPAERLSLPDAESKLQVIIRGL